MNGKLTWSIFWALVGVFIVILCLFFIPAFSDLLAGSELFLTPFAVFFLLGIALIVLTLKGKVAGTFKKLFLLTGASSAGFFVSILLHNFISGWLNVEEPVFFSIAIFVCPLGFLVGVVGSIVSRYQEL